MDSTVFLYKFLVARFNVLLQCAAGTKSKCLRLYPGSRLYVFRVPRQIRRNGTPACDLRSANYGLLDSNLSDYCGYPPGYNSNCEGVLCYESFWAQTCKSTAGDEH